MLQVSYGSGRDDRPLWFISCLDGPTQQRGIGPGRFFKVVLEVIADASGFTVEEIQIQTQEGTTFAEILESSGADIDAVRESLLQALAELPNAADLDLEQMADQWLGLDE